MKRVADNSSTWGLMYAVISLLVHPQQIYAWNRASFVLFFWAAVVALHVKCLKRGGWGRKEEESGVNDGTALFTLK